MNRFVLGCALIGSMLVVTGCLLDEVEMAGKACDATHACLETYSCVDGACTIEANEPSADPARGDDAGAAQSDAGTDGDTDRGTRAASDAG